jgi:DNA mismatch repair protein MutH
MGNDLEDDFLVIAILDQNGEVTFEYPSKIKDRIQAVLWFERSADYGVEVSSI